MAFASVVFIVFGVILNVAGRKGWGWSMIVLGALVAMAAVL